MKCLEFDTSRLSPTECMNECKRWNISTEYRRVDRIPDDQKRCIARDDDDCSYVYTYNKQNDTDLILLTVQQGLSKSISFSFICLENIVGRCSTLSYVSFSTPSPPLVCPLQQVLK